MCAFCSVERTEFVKYNAFTGLKTDENTLNLFHAYLPPDQKEQTVHGPVADHR